MQSARGKCITPGCTNAAYRRRCPSCVAREATEKSLQQDLDGCKHQHSITGDFGMIQRLLPEYQGGEPQLGYMLDICKSCLKELDERPYNPNWPAKRH